MRVVTAIVSGGQTGADRGGLDAAIALDLGHGGWAPKGWRAEDGCIPEIYRAHMRESVSPEYGLRTRLNMQDSDGTLIVSFSSELTGGSEYTAKQAKAQRKPCKHLVLPRGGETRIPDAVRTAVLEWIDASHISVLNVAGPRESKEPGIQAAVRDALVWIFEDDSSSVRQESDEVVLGALATAAMFVESGPQIGDVIGELRDGTPVRWGGNGNGNMKARSTDQDAFLLPEKS